VRAFAWFGQVEASDTDVRREIHTGEGRRGCGGGERADERRQEAGDDEGQRERAASVHTPIHCFASCDHVTLEVAIAVLDPALGVSVCVATRAAVTEL
jgi:hypothetical protein